MIQEISRSDTVEAFLEIDVGNDYERSPEKWTVELGDDALWAFRSTNGKVVAGTNSELIEILAKRLRQDEFRNFPLIENQVAEFCREQRFYRMALTRSFESIGKRSSLMAEIWRDSVVLLPIAKRELALEYQNQPDFDQINDARLASRGKTIELSLPATIYDRIQSNKQSIEFKNTSSIGRAFGLSKVSIARQTSSQNKPKSSIDSTPFGIINSLSGIGDLVVRDMPRTPRGYMLQAPWSTRTRRSTPSSPFVAFTILNADRSKFERSKKIAEQTTDATVKVAIVTMPISFGTQNGSKIDVTELQKLKPQYDYIFIISNHLLSNPIAIAPRLTASSRAVKYVRACIDGFMQIVWASDEIRTSQEFVRIFPRNGFCLVGRGTDNRDRKTTALFEAIASTANERLPIHHGKRLALIGPKSITQSRQATDFLDQAVASTTNSVASIEVTSSKRGVTILGFGIDVAKPSSHRFREFCLELLRIKGITISRETEQVALGHLVRHRVAFAFARSERMVEDALEALKSFRNAEQCILTSYKPHAALTDYLNGRRITILHYSSLDRFLSSRRLNEG